MRKKTNEEFLIDLYKVHGDTYIPQEAYTGNHDKIKVLCTNCNNIISIRPMVLLKGQGCSICAQKRINAKLTHTHEQFLEKLKNKYKDKYTPIDKYINNRTKIKMHCNDCGCEWSITPANLLSGHGCPQCAINNSKAVNKVLSKEDFIKQLKNQHKDSYTLLDEYVDENTVIKFHCNICNSDFSAIPKEILAPGIYCQTCKENQKALKQEQINYAVYYIEEIATQKPIYVGITNNLSVRFRQHFTSINDPLYKLFHDKDWRNMFCMVLIKEDITRHHALDIEAKYIHDFFSQGYTLYNTDKIKTQVEAKKVKYTRDSIKKVKCVETGEIFSSISEAIRQYNVNYDGLMNACIYGDSAGIDDNLQPLHWCFEPFKEYTVRSTKTYSIYAIEELINDTWTPFYVGVTKQTLQERLSNHCMYNLRNPAFNPEFYNKLCAKGKEYFKTNIRIRAIQEGIVNKQEAYRIEKETINQYNKLYKIVNKKSIKKDINEK